MNGIIVLAERQIEVFGLNGTVLWITIPICADCYMFWYLVRNK